MSVPVRKHNTGLPTPQSAGAGAEPTQGAITEDLVAVQEAVAAVEGRSVDVATEETTMDCLRLAWTASDCSGLPPT